MTTVRILESTLSFLWERGRFRKEMGMLFAGKLLRAVLVGMTCSTAVLAQDRPVHWLNAGAMPPGAIGRQRLMRGGPLSGFCQPVEIRAPKGARIAPATGSGFMDTQSSPLSVGLPIGPVYRFKVTDIPGEPGLELFPTIELVDRLYPPPGQALRFPIPIELTRDELLLAAEGRFITRVVYLEDPLLAPAIARDNENQPWFEARPGEDPLVIADHLGRPVAIVRIGGRVPESNQPNPAFVYGGPEPLIYDQETVKRAQAKPQAATDSALPLKSVNQ